MVVEIGDIEKLGPKAKSTVEKLGPRDKPAAGPTCTTKTFGYDYKVAGNACSNYAGGTTSTYYWDESTGYLYSDSCGGTEAAAGYYADGDGYRFYNLGTHTLSAVIAGCRP